MRAGHIRILFRYLFTSSSAFSTVRSQPRVQIITGLIPYSDISSPYLFTLHASDRAGSHMRAKCRGLSNLAIEPLAGLCGDARDACIQLYGIRMFDLFARRDDEIVRSLSGSSESSKISPSVCRPKLSGGFGWILIYAYQKRKE